MRQKCRFNSSTDIQRTIPGLAVDLGLAVENGVVLDTGVDAQYNDLDDPANIRGRVRDAFGAIDAQRAVLATGKIVNTSASAGGQSVNPTGKLE